MLLKNFVRFLYKFRVANYYYLIIAVSYNVIGKENLKHSGIQVLFCPTRLSHIPSELIYCFFDTKDASN